MFSFTVKVEVFAPDCTTTNNPSSELRIIGSVFALSSASYYFFNLLASDFLIASAR